MSYEEKSYEEKNYEDKNYEEKNYEAKNYEGPIHSIYGDDDHNNYIMRTIILF